MTASRTGRMARRLTALALSVAATAALSSCGGTDDPSEPPSPSASTTSDAPSESPGGLQTADQNGAQLSAPADWNVRFDDPYWLIDAPGDDGSSPGGAVLDADTASLARNTEELAGARLNAAGPGAKRLPDVKYGGYTFFHIRETNDTNTFENFGVLIKGSQVAVEWTFTNAFATQEQIDGLIDEVMPTFKFVG
ncbi:hypothetical protein ACFU7D_00460 [Nocardioides sp. NPDC057577]|uniref:hypothetical protein n=1 Tax=Nocardioides sp. NPDC057577 TaxID=3346171 RepID=UPI003670FFC7